MWEPFLLVDDNELIVCYSDQRDTNHGQKPVQRVSIDLRIWGPAVDGVSMPAYADRPGMPWSPRCPKAPSR
ncbi:hypothetical protein [Streptomyces bullii]|uniref:Uncharacterized protein n=1 Tax=Streptomyces bullii TaxID=349910 RepID=A0ABW0V2G5_9ACTN